MADPAGSLELFLGQPALTLSLTCGDQLRVLLHGGQVVSWVAAGRERLYLSPRARLDGRSAIRGGVPVCFPQFNQRGPLPRHGFARNLPWALEGYTEMGQDRAALTLRLEDSAATRVHWAQTFEARLTVALRPGELQVTLAVRNTDQMPLEFTGALHTYLAVDDIAQVELQGLDGQPEWDALTDCHGCSSGPLRFPGEFDRVYGAARGPLVLREGRTELAIEQSASWAETVVWNPGAQQGTALPDLPAGGHARMLCVEAAQVSRPIVVVPGSTWQGWQRLSLH